MITPARRWRRARSGDERMQLDGSKSAIPRFAHYVLANAPLEMLADGFRWIEGLVWMGDANCLLFQDLPRDRTLRWIEDAGVSVLPAAVPDYGNGQTP